MSATEKFEHYEVLKREDGSPFELGRGAMGITYKALDTDLECFVALKIINPSTIANKDAEQRFFREARSAAQLRHPNIASVFRLGKTEDGAHYYAMEFCEGLTLQELVERSGPIDCRRALQFTLQITKALIVAEERHLVHRDLKPSNLIVTQRSDEGEVIKVIDFGLAKTTNPNGTMWSSMGTQGFIGTAHFASPEQIEDKAVDTRSDIYSLGSTLWFMLLGKPPFEGSLARIMSQHLTTAPDFSQLHGVPGNVIPLIRRMLEKSPEDRPQSALDLRRDILDCLGISGAKEEAAESQAALPAMEPPVSEFVDAAQKANGSPPEVAWTASLRELLRVRGALSPAEAFCLGEVLATRLDKDPDSPQSAFRVQDIIIHFHDSPKAEQIRSRLREDTTAWPPFDLAIHSVHATSPLDLGDPSQMTTIVPGEETTGDRAQQLARLLYELLGGVAGSRYVPVARLGEAGNEALKRATVVGYAGSPTLLDLVRKLRTSSEISSTPPIFSSGRPATPNFLDPETPHSSAQKAFPEPDSKILPNQAKTWEPVKSSGWKPAEPPSSPPQSSRDPIHASKNTGRSSRLGIALRVLVAVVGLIAIFNGVKTFYSGVSNSRGSKQNDIPSSPQTDSPSTPSPIATALAPIQFTLFDDLGAGQISESALVYVDDQTEPAATIALTPQQPHGPAAVRLPSAGHHVFSVKTESVVVDLDKGSKKIISSGRWERDFLGGEKYDLSATPQDAGDSYQLQVAPRN